MGGYAWAPSTARLANWPRQSGIRGTRGAVENKSIAVMNTVVKPSGIYCVRKELATALFNFSYEVFMRDSSKVRREKAPHRQSFPCFLGIICTTTKRDSLHGLKINILRMMTAETDSITVKD